MRPNYELIVALLLLTLDVDGRRCRVEFKECRDRGYDAILGKDLTIHCTVAFCHNTPPRVSWYRRDLEGSEHVPVDVSNSSHITAEWELLKGSDWRLFLTFQQLLRNHSGVYQCQGDGRVSYDITVHVIESSWLHGYRGVRIGVFVIIILTLLCIALTCRCKGEDQDSDCYVDFKVPHSTLYEAFLGEKLQISCTVVFCDSPPPTVSWFKREHTDVPVNVSRNSHIKTEWELLDQLRGRSVLIFQKILRNDSGLYQCKSGLSVSHIIKVIVHDGVAHTNVTLENGTRSTTLLPEPEPAEDLWMYVYIAAGIVAFVVIIIIISVLSMRGCKGKPKKEMQIDIQYVEIPMAEQPVPRSGLQASTPPSQRSTRRQRPPSQPDELPLPSNGEQVYSKTKDGRERRENTVQEEERSVVYAALNHQLPAGRTTQPRRPKEETSEYAAIRFT